MPEEDKKEKKEREAEGGEYQRSAYYLFNVQANVTQKSLKLSHKPGVPSSLGK
jgi:hypothetical protein